MDSRVNPRQVEVLKWIADGCPDGRWPAGDYSHVLSGNALANRGLAAIKGRGPRWSASITDDGRYYLEHGSYPPGHRFGPKPKRTEPAVREDPQPPQSASSTRRCREPQPVEQNFQIDSPRRKAVSQGQDGQEAAHPWDDRVLVSVKEAAWVLSVSTALIYDAVREGDIDRVFIGEGTKHYRIVYNSLLAWVNDLPTEPVRGW
ncbi:helix-turn-helix domain-containing protein [Pimelobacter simplex]|uniref:helix-turn-helix domain-containing protein n=1 Tax=Nocardioides simplex TaxID=2045 RepID=UPI003AAF006D